MNVNFEAIEKAWFKPKKNVLDELEEWLKEQRNYYYEYPYYSDFNAYGSNCDDVLDKIQELKKENENGRIF